MNFFTHNSRWPLIVLTMGFLHCTFVSFAQNTNSHHLFVSSKLPVMDFGIGNDELAVKSNFSTAWELGYQFQRTLTSISYLNIGLSVGTESHKYRFDYNSLEQSFDGAIKINTVALSAGAGVRVLKSWNARARMSYYFLKPVYYSGSGKEVDRHQIKPVHNFSSYFLPRIALYADKTFGIEGANCISFGLESNVQSREIEIEVFKTFTRVAHFSERYFTLMPSITFNRRL